MSNHLEVIATIKQLITDHEGISVKGLIKVLPGIPKKEVVRIRAKVLSDMAQQERLSRLSEAVNKVETLQAKVGVMIHWGHRTPSKIAQFLDVETDDIIPLVEAEIKHRNELRTRATRSRLNLRLNERARFTGVFVRYGEKPGYRGNSEKTILLRDIRPADERDHVVSDHLWFNLTKGFAALGILREGDRIEFEARVGRYEKGYAGRRQDVDKPIETDYKLGRPTKIRRLADSRD